MGVPIMSAANIVAEVFMRRLFKFCSSRRADPEVRGSPNGMELATIVTTARMRIMESGARELNDSSGVRRLPIVLEIRQSVPQCVLAN